MPYAPIRSISFQGKSSILSTRRKLCMPSDEQTLPSSTVNLPPPQSISSSPTPHCHPTSHCADTVSAHQSHTPKKVIKSPTSLEIQSLYSSLSSQSKSKPCILSLVKDYSSSFVPKSLHPDLPPILSSMYDTNYLTMNYTELLSVSADIILSVTPPQCNAIHKTAIKIKPLV